ncbi:MAG TPA: isoprenylcysteine carboxylmethyltransferase family protein [Bryobacteraceae bacterium]|jgi:protein-S-isoprenylcysteine O-methyltransferase Ste14
MTSPQTSGVKIFPPLIQIGAIAIGFLIEWIVPVRIGDGFGIVRIAGCILLAIAGALIASAAKIMFGAGTTPNPTRPSTVIVTSGPFRFTRNPMYLAWELICIGVGLVANVLWPVLMALPAAIVTRKLVIDKEERYLEQKFGAEYLTYKSRVRRWV